MIDRETGAMQLEHGVVLDASFTPQQLAGSPLGPKAVPYIHNLPWESFVVQTRCSDGTPVHLTLSFFNRTLKSIHLYLSQDPADDEKGEMLRRHEAWIRDQLGQSPFRGSWGSAVAAYNPRNDTSNLVLTYGEPIP
ncbi:hypothetical protein [Chondromyces apiculatus]|uniref:Uncharacterized protein n=1 Tax=Chondromyces apiculatus DSM 436 TaxID=1192034 RepID=A0A017T669_9BACT|nr:hypothetical protein [Chondromyces apiculatus]EYF04714.1 Hypothetical protein CAP_4189 [Chondromyces apiculatus DSM 436]